MRLTQLKLAGFKSFVDPTVIPVSSQLVGVVGPNGCGKSNIIDAVRWVLGEKRASELRGESMQDVIFNGSGNRKPAARASVELVFDNAEGRAAGQWSVYSEIAVRRVLTRDGTSSYYVNNQQVRLKDIRDIFLGTGLGAQGYAIIGQGMINRLIEARPEDLRVLLEEAAGVSRYKERRKETESRLKDTRDNLQRLYDEIMMLDGRLEKLQAQAEVAGRYRQLQDDGEKKQHALWLLREENALSDQQKKNQEIESARTELEGSMAELRSAEAEVEARRQSQYAASDAVHVAQTAMYEVNTQVSRLEVEIKSVVESRNRLQLRKAQLKQQIQEWQEQFEHANEQIAELEQERETAFAKTEELTITLEDKRTGLPALEDTVKAKSQERETVRAEIVRIEQNLALTAQSQRDSDRQMQQLEQRQERLEQELRGMSTPDTSRLNQLRGDKTALEDQLEEAQARLHELEERLPILDEERAKAQQLSQAESQTLARLEARMTALLKLQEDVQKQGDLEPWLQKHGLESFTRLWQKISIDAGWEKTLEAVLRERLSAIELRDLELGKAFLDDAPPSRLAFYQKTAVLPQSQTVNGLRTLLSIVRCQDIDLKNVLAHWLRNVFISDNLASALAVRNSLPEGAIVLSASGHMIDKVSISFYAADSEQSGLLARQQEIDNLQRELKARQLIADQTIAGVAKAEGAWNQLSQSIVPARQRLAELTRRLHDLQLEYSRLEQQTQQSDERVSRIQEDLSEIKGLKQELIAQREEAEANFEILDMSLGEMQEKFADMEMSGEDLAATVASLQNVIRDVERQIQESEFSQRSIAARIAELNRNKDLATAQSQQAENELQSNENELFSYNEEASKAGLQEALEERAAKEEALNLARIEMDNLAALLRSADEKRLSIEHSLQPRRDRIMQLQLDEQAARLAVEQFSEQLNTQEVDREALKVYLATQDDDWKKVTWLQSEVQRISRQIDALGSVNLAALDELKESMERKNFLDAQHADLNEAITTLEEAIRKIDRETRELLRDTFNVVNGHFGELFPRLFGGGEAKLNMTGDEILDAGVQVMAQPPGKRNSTIHLLSGGEKALTATALVFAFFKLNPAPFCLLDEVDAPLDDANTERYANLVSNMSDQTQFLFISHNKIAMQMAKQLVGVTMQEQGVSRIVAVDIESAIQLTNEV